LHRVSQQTTPVATFQDHVPIPAASRASRFRCSLSAKSFWARWRAAAGFIFGAGFLGVDSLWEVDINHLLGGSCSAALMEVSVIVCRSCTLVNHQRSSPIGRIAGNAGGQTIFDDERVYHTRLARNLPPLRISRACREGRSGITELSWARLCSPTQPDQL